MFDTKCVGAYNALMASEAITAPVRREAAVSLQGVGFLTRLFRVWGSRESGRPEWLTEASSMDGIAAELQDQNIKAAFCVPTGRSSDEEAFKIVMRARIRIDEHYAGGRKPWEHPLEKHIKELEQRIEKTRDEKAAHDLEQAITALECAKSDINTVLSLFPEYELNDYFIKQTFADQKEKVGLWHRDNLMNEVITVVITNDGGVSTEYAENGNGKHRVELPRGAIVAHRGTIFHRSPQVKRGEGRCRTVIVLKKKGEPKYKSS